MHLLIIKAATGLNISTSLNFEHEHAYFFCLTCRKHSLHRDGELLQKSSLMCWSALQFYSLLFGCIVQKTSQDLTFFNALQLHSKTEGVLTGCACCMHSTTHASVRRRGKRKWSVNYCTLSVVLHVINNLDQL